MPAVPGPENLAATSVDPLKGDSALWDLLDRAPRPSAPGPFFERRVLRAVACFEAERAVPGWRRRWDALVAAAPPRGFAWSWSGASFAGAAVAVLLTFGTFNRWSGPTSGSRRHHHDGAPGMAAATAPERNSVDGSAAQPQERGAVRESDVNVIADLDEVTESNENHVWLDEDDENAS